MENLVEGLLIRGNSQGGVLVAIDDKTFASLPTHSDGKRRFLIRKGKGQSLRAVIIKDKCQPESKAILD